jgi:hypothetical protein
MYNNPYLSEIKNIRGKKRFSLNFKKKIMSIFFGQIAQNKKKGTVVPL